MVRMRLLSIQIINELLGGNIDVRSLSSIANFLVGKSWKAYERFR
jgi:hypothetical protein